MRKGEQRKGLSLEALHADKNRVLVVAHRGSSGSAPENTVAAFQLALESGADIIECDIRLTRDEEVVIFHDRTLNRTTNGSGPVQDKTLKELKSLDAGSWFSSKFKGEGIPTLSEALQFLDGRAFLNIELKADASDHQTNVHLENRVLETVRDAQAEHRILVASFNHRLMREIKARHPELTTAVIYKAVRDFASRPSRLVSRSGAEAFVCGRWWLRRKLLEDLQVHHIPLFVYTVNREHDVERMIRLRVNGVITNFPDMVVRTRNHICSC
jgi:glycerophosphoryl diester phosphodiesterase